MDNVVTVQWLKSRLGQDNLVVADCRFDLAEPTAGRSAYAHDHIVGAVFFDLDKDLSAASSSTGGRHPLPPLDQFAAKLGDAGIGDGVTVVCYDESSGGMAARLWWMLRYLGHPAVALLDGGYDAWKAAAYPVTAEVPEPTPRRFVPRVQTDMIATMDDVRAVVAKGDGIIVDSRAPERYRGEVEPLDPIAGHIPGALNFPWQANAGADGLFLGPDELSGRFARLPEDDDVIVHCGSGVTGCVNILALERAGRRGAKLYVGGWSEWCADADNPIATVRTDREPSADAGPSETSG